MIKSPIPKQTHQLTEEILELIPRAERLLRRRDPYVQTAVIANLVADLLCGFHPDSRTLAAQELAGLIEQMQCLHPLWKKEAWEYEKKQAELKGRK